MAKLVDLDGLAYFYSKIKAMLADKLGKNDTAAAAIKDDAGNTISTTYASKADVSALLSTKLGVTATAYAATRDGAGNNIVDTYAKKTDISGMIKSVNGKAPDAGGNVNVANMTGASDSAAGKAGLVPAPAAGMQNKFLCSDATWKDAGGIPVGHEFFTTNPNIPAGCIPLLGGEYSRTAYADLWAWVQTQAGYLIEESAWQAKAAANSGNVPFYSSGDGSTTFRVPSLKCWVKSGSSISEVGSYLEAGLPNILGSAGHFNSLIEYVYSGAMFEKSSKYTADSNAGGTQAKEIGFDASRSNKIYGNSDTVQPPSIVGMWLVKAYGTVINVGSTDVANISTGLAQAETRISSLETNKVDKAGNAWVVESYRNGAEWYRVWSDGWIEQGGVILFNSYSSIVQTITFPTAFTNTDYTFITNPIYNGDVNGRFIVEYTSDIYGKKDSRTTTSIQCAGGMSRSWYACGY